MSSDSGNWPVYGGRDIYLWNPATEKSECFASIDPDIYIPHLVKKRRNQARTKTSAFYGLPQETLDDPTTLSCYKPRIVFRDVTRALDTRTIIAALIPPKHAPTLTIPYLEWRDAPPRAEAYLLGVLSSMICDWQARRTVELHMTFALFGNLPIPQVNIDDDPLAQRVIKIAGTLAAVDERFADWAAEVGVPIGTATDDNPEYKQELIEELDACVALLYGLDEDDLACLYETFHEGKDYSDRHQAVLAHFRRLSASQEQDSLTTSDDTTSPDES